MNSLRKTIRHAFRELLTGRTVQAGRNVFSSRIHPLMLEELPAINVWAGDEESEEYTQAPLSYRKTLDIVIELFIRSVESADDKMDDFINAVQSIIDGSDLFTLNGKVSSIRYAEGHVELRGESTKEGAVATLIYKVTYYTSAGVTAEDLPDLEVIHANWNDPAPDAVTQDEIIFP